MTERDLELAGRSSEFSLEIERQSQIGMSADVVGIKSEYLLVFFDGQSWFLVVKIRVRLLRQAGDVRCGIGVCLGENMIRRENEQRRREGAESPDAGGLRESLDFIGAGGVAWCAHGGFLTPVRIADSGSVQSAIHFCSGTTSSAVRAA